MDFENTKVLMNKTRKLARLDRCVLVLSVLWLVSSFVIVCLAATMLAPSSHPQRPPASEQARTNYAAARAFLM